MRKYHIKIAKISMYVYNFTNFPRTEHSIVAQSVYRESHSFSRPLVRFFASDDNIKGGPSRGIIGNISSTNIGRTSTNDLNSIGIAKSGAYGSSDNTNPYESREDEKGQITSQMNVTQPITECGKLCPDDSSKEESKMGSSKSNHSGSVSRNTNDTAKQWQEVTANLPSKEQVEKFSFRILAFIYDILALTINWSIRFVNEKVLANDTVKLYWKRFHEKMEEAKKD